MENSTPPSSPSRRDVLTVAAVTVTLPMLQSALGRMKSAQAAAAAPATPAAAAPAAWVTTTLKAADLKENEFTAVAGQKVLVTRNGKEVSAVTNVCTHRACAMKPQAGQKTITCQCHKSVFNLDGTVSKGPATKPLDHYAIRVNDKGLVEVNPSKAVAKDAKEAAAAIS